MQEHQHNGECEFEEEIEKPHFLSELIVSMALNLWQNMVRILFLLSRDKLEINNTMTWRYISMQC
jgi:hypothetical protein